MPSTSLTRAAAPEPVAPDRHEHGWTTESAHRTSEGLVRYVRCAVCGIRRVDLQPSRTARTPAAASAEIGQPISPG
ncbi:hypothetical protein [Microbacterium sp. cf332]|uniref:hypothetical protein n=1 Tax=Microbacterium sp. cf332 TaxID=1761804 RepID=UPI000B857256|nr:hypothetical protein [Microbacterium sp. cf332]